MSYMHPSSCIQSFYHLPLSIPMHMLYNNYSDKRMGPPRSLILPSLCALFSLCLSPFLTVLHIQFGLRLLRKPSLTSPARWDNPPICSNSILSKFLSPLFSCGNDSRCSHQWYQCSQCWTTGLISSATTVISRNGAHPVPGTGPGALNAGLGKS